VRRTEWIATVVMLTAALLQAQVGAKDAQGVTPSSRTDFGTLCGIKDSSPQLAQQFVRSGADKWSAAQKEKMTGSNMAARVWHEKNWMIDLHDSPANSPEIIHTGQICFDPQGRITRMIDRYMEMAQCRCMRFTSFTFTPDGKEQREVHYVDAFTGQEEQQPPGAKNLPLAWKYRRLQELPFYSLIKK
jgi:hypothetical protein